MIVAHGGHLGNWWSYVTDPNSCIVIYSPTELSTCSNISLIPQIIFLTACCHLKLVLRDSRWQPSWKLAAILKYSEHFNSINNISCTFSMLQHTLCCHSNLFWPFITIFKAKNNIEGNPMAAILETCGHIEICVARVFCVESDPPKVFVPNLLLVS